MKRSGDNRQLIVQTWINSGEGAVTTKLLREIQSVLAQSGSGAVLSPAAIARILADEDAELRHPDIIEMDAEWRESQLKKSAASVSADPTRPLTLQRAEALLRRFENRRRKLSSENEGEELGRLREAALNQKARAQLLARDRAFNESIRQVQSEVAEWFRVWLQTPELFDDWLDLRRRSPEFRETFKRQNSGGSV